MKSDQDSSSFGRYLQAIRLEKKISLEQISAQTRIGIANLTLIEQEDHENLPAEVFVKGFLRSFAEAIGADGDEAIRRYETRLNVVQKIAVSDNFIGKSAPNMWWKLLIAMVLLTGIIVVSIFGIAYFKEQNKPGHSPKDRAAVENAQKAGAPEVQDTEQAAKSGGEVAEKMLLKITAVEDTWLKVIVDEKDSTEYNLSPGDKVELEAISGYNLLIGNSGGLNIIFNDKPVQIPGKSGEVVTINLP